MPTPEPQGGPVATGPVRLRQTGLFYILLKAVPKTSSKTTFKIPLSPPLTVPLLKNGLTNLGYF